LTQVIVRVTDAGGETGVGEAWWGIPDRAEHGRGGRPIKQALDDLIAPRVIGRESGEIEKLWFELWDFGYRYADQGIYQMALSGLDLALWDLLGKRLHAPVVQLLGGAVHDGLPAYASLPPLRDIGVVVAETGRAIEAGLAAVKLHELSIDYVVALRERFGRDLRIMVDVNGHFDPLDAIALGRQLAAHDIVWYEEPVRPMRDHAALKRVRDACGVDLAAGENEYTVADFDRLLGCGALAYVQPEITKIGGLTPAKRISALAELRNVALCPHNFRNGPSLYASIHWGLSSPATRWMEVPWVADSVRFAAGMGMPPLRNGRVFAPDGDGLGVALG
jgi:L-alanine-DL-glutamate epimerase-like enolase superfamily enzyme